MSPTPILVLGILSVLGIPVAVDAEGGLHNQRVTSASEHTII